jgi:hypothetical protein
MMSGYEDYVFSFTESSHFDAQQWTTLKVEWLTSFITAKYLQLTFDSFRTDAFEAAHSEFHRGSVTNHLHRPVVENRECRSECLVPQRDAFKRGL